MARLLSLCVAFVCVALANAANCTSYKAPLANETCLSTCLPFGGAVLTTSRPKNKTCFMKADNSTADYVEGLRVDSGAECVYTKKNATVTTSIFYCCCQGA